MKLCLLVLTAGKQEGKKLEVKVSPFLIGRDAECHLRPASPLISKKHCAFILRDGKVFLQDFDSTNGSVVNGQPIKGEVELKDKDRVKVGPIEFQVMLEVGTPQKTPQKVPAQKAGSTVKKPAPVAATPGTTEGTDETVNDESTSTRETAEGTDDDIGAMLLAMGDDVPGDTSVTNAEIPDGSTVMEMVVPPEAAQADKDKMQKAKEQQASTSQAARDILSKYMRRPRG